MRTNIDIDEGLVAEAMVATGTLTKKAAVEVALKVVVQRHRRLKALEEMAGTGWEGDLDAMRKGWGPPELL